MHFLWWILVGLIAGWAAGKIMKGSGYGTLGDIILGIVGAVVGGWIMQLLGFSGQGGTIYTILIAILGAVIWCGSCAKLKESNCPVRDARCADTSRDRRCLAFC